MKGKHLQKQVKSKIILRALLECCNGSTYCTLKGIETVCLFLQRDMMKLLVEEWKRRRKNKICFTHRNTIGNLSFEYRSLETTSNLFNVNVREGNIPVLNMVFDVAQSRVEEISKVVYDEKAMKLQVVYLDPSVYPF